MAIIQISMMSNCFRRSVSISVILPVENLVFQEEGKPRELPPMNPGPFKTLYLLHGYTGDHLDWLTYSNIRQLAQEHRLAVVMPSGENSFYINHEAAGEFYSDFISQELLAMTRGIFPLSTKREDTFIGGISMGGYGALLTALKHPETFSHVFAMSSALQLCENRPTEANTLLPYIEGTFGPLGESVESEKNPRHVFESWKNAGMSGESPRVFMACGTEDRLITMNRYYRDFFSENNFDLTYFESPGVHSWDFWNGYLKKAIEWLP
ncbi:alpha/beta hydrolase family protein [uncultured Oscillibacter sp.]|uniref:alpha/beta hydrolase n=1 Tax=uncultured Oscillibacter sp. TaxID=876091 RepID=UPI00263703A7|nr:alpha/beta hydrolase family protein [uncultured Oscillibacter sp.]